MHFKVTYPPLWTRLGRTGRDQYANGYLINQFGVQNATRLGHSDDTPEDDAASARLKEDVDGACYQAESSEPVTLEANDLINFFAHIDVFDNLLVRSKFDYLHPVLLLHFPLCLYSKLATETEVWVSARSRSDDPKRRMSTPTSRRIAKQGRQSNAGVLS